ncbi:hypothetical protein GCQ56_08885 [Marinifilum sp. N1E240]|uniref:STAS/SEC14 domain-containing protein n=1 Tax=Marinifilum sp. N1E240 TaxID=2608082 RepID=UPI00128CFB63|nr:STAS/SEC14 domain-containing protein [Marinifilum sp. N1E240]MPQ47131.1 hypothetical protein [Marinifilum sp. N1E240]
MLKINTLHNIVSVEFTDGKITSSDIDELFNHVELFQNKNKEISILLLLGNHEKVGLKTSIETFRRTFQLVHQIKKIAIISEHDQSVIAFLDNLLCPWEEKYFNIDDLNKAWEWIKHDS